MSDQPEVTLGQPGTEEGQEPEEGQEIERPGWLPERFKTPEDLAKSYDEAERALGRHRTEAQQYKTQLEAVGAQLSAAGWTVNDYGQLVPPAGGGGGQAAQPQVQEEEEEIDFFADPQTAITKVLRKELSARDAQIRKEMQEQIAPFVGTLASTVTAQTMERLERQMGVTLPEPVRQAAAKIVSGMDAMQRANPQAVEMAVYMALGQYAASGGAAGGPEPMNQRGNQNPPPPPPPDDYRRTILSGMGMSPSRPGPSTGAGGQEPLTDFERELARREGMSEKEWRAQQKALEDDDARIRSRAAR